MKFLVASHQHGLLPFAWRLRKEKHEVEVLVFQDRFEKAWEGMFPKVITGNQKGRDSLVALATLAVDEGYIVLTDSHRGMAVFSDVPNLFGMFDTEPATNPSPLAVGGWFDGTAVVEGSEHMLVRDWGLWPGGLGESYIGGCSLVRRVPRAFSPVLKLERYLSWLTGSNFKGLFSIDIGMEPVDGEINLVAGALSAGWDMPHAHAFISDLDSLGGLMGGAKPQLLSDYVVALPISLPPWPYSYPASANRKSAPVVEVTGLTDKDTRSIFFHDFRTDEKYKVWTAGTDGLVAVVRGAAAHPDLARLRAVSLAEKIHLPGKQYRPDAGATLTQVLMGLEDAGMMDGEVPLSEPLSHTPEEHEAWAEQMAS